MRYNIIKGIRIKPYFLDKVDQSKNEPLTHLIVVTNAPPGTDVRAWVHRSFGLAQAITQGRWCLSSNWIKASLLDNRNIWRPEKYEACDTLLHGASGAQRARLAEDGGRPGLLQETGFLLDQEDLDWGPFGLGMTR